MLYILKGKIVPVSCGVEFKRSGYIRDIHLKGKPVIYLYPEKPMDISVQLKLKDSVFTTTILNSLKKILGIFMLNLMELFQSRIKNIHIYSGKHYHMVYQIQMKVLL